MQHLQFICLNFHSKDFFAITFRKYNPTVLTHFSLESRTYGSLYMVNKCVYRQNTQPVLFIRNMINLKYSLLPWIQWNFLNKGKCWLLHTLKITIFYSLYLLCTNHQNQSKIFVMSPFPSCNATEYINVGYECRQLCGLIRIYLQPREFHVFPVRPTETYAL